MGCGSSAPEVNDNNFIKDSRKKGEKPKNVQVDVSEDPEMQGEKYHMDNTENEEESGENKKSGEKDSFADF